MWLFFCNLQDLDKKIRLWPVNCLEFAPEVRLMTKIRFIICVLCLVGMVALIPWPASADALYSTLGPGGTYDTSVGWTLGAPPSSSFNQVPASQFTLGTGATVGDAMLALWYVDGNDTVNVYIESDNSGMPDIILATLSEVGPIAAYPGGLVAFTCSGPQCMLGAGAYWLVAQQPVADSWSAWFYDYQDASGPVAFNDSGSATGPWFPSTGPQGAFQIDSAVPEPTSILLFASVVLGIGIARRRSIGRG
jgi:hypothetical protein